MSNLKFRQIAFLGFLSTFLSSAYGKEYDWCALGESLAPGREFIQVRRIRVNVEGAPLGEFAAPFSEVLIQKRVWPGQADTVHVSRYIPKQCGPELAGANAVKVAVSPAEAQAIVREFAHRGENPDLPTTTTVSVRADTKLSPTAVPPSGATKIHSIRIYFATNRAPVSNAAANAFGAIDAQKLSLGSVDVSIPAGHSIGQLESPSILRFFWTPNPAKYVSLAPTIHRMLPTEWQAQVRSRADALNRPGVLLFVHGYNVTFGDGARRAAQLASDIAFEGPIVYFSWPSDGELLPYLHDDYRATTARYLMADLLKTLANLSPALPVYVVAHSMGNRVMLQGLAEAFERDPSLHHSFRQVVLASPDIGQLEFKQLFQHSLGGTDPRYTLYASDNDIPIGISTWLRGEPRLGSGGANVFVLSGIDTIDASAITKSFFGIEHSYFADHTTLLSDLFTLIHSGYEPSKRFGLHPVESSTGRYWEFLP